MFSLSRNFLFGGRGDSWVRRASSLEDKPIRAGALNFRAAILVEREGRKAEEVGQLRVEKMVGASALLSVSLKALEPLAFGRVAATVW